jgi:acyl carrier protein
MSFGARFFGGTAAMNRVKKKIKAIACEILGCKRISFRKRFRRIGFESLSFTELVVKTEEAFGIELLIDEIARFRTLKMFAVYAESKIDDSKRHL